MAFLHKFTENICAQPLSLFLKQKGFNVYTGAKYFNKKPSGYGMRDFTPDTPYYISGYDNLLNDYFNQDVMILAPSHDLVMKWLRDMHRIFVTVSLHNTLFSDRFQFTVIKPNLEAYIFHSDPLDPFTDYAKATDAAITQALTLIESI